MFLMILAEKRLYLLYKYSIVITFLLIVRVQRIQNIPVNHSWKNSSSTHAQQALVKGLSSTPKIHVNKEVWRETEVRRGVDIDVREATQKPDTQEDFIQELEEELNQDLSSSNPVNDQESNRDSNQESNRDSNQESNQESNHDSSHELNHDSNPESSDDSNRESNADSNNESNDDSNRESNDDSNHESRSESSTSEEEEASEGSSSSLTTTPCSSCKKVVDENKFLRQEIETLILSNSTDDTGGCVGCKALAMENLVLQEKAGVGSSSFATGNVRPAFPCDDWDGLTRTCYLDRNIGDTVTFVLSFHKRANPEIQWAQEFHLYNSKKRKQYIIDPENPLWNIVIGSRGHEMRISPITEIDIDFNYFSATIISYYAKIHKKRIGKTHPLDTINFRIRVMPTDLGFVYPGETLMLNMKRVNLPPSNMKFKWYLEKEGEYSSLPSNVRLSPTGGVLTISELRKEQEGILACAVFTNMGFFATKQRFLVKEMNHTHNMLLYVPTRPGFHGRRKRSVNSDYYIAPSKGDSENNDVVEGIEDDYATEIQLSHDKRQVNDQQNHAPQNINQQQYSPQNVNQQQYPPPQSPVEQRNSPAQNPEQQQYSPPQNTNVQQYSPVQNPNQQQYSPPQSPNEQRYSSAQNPNQQQYSPPQSPVAQENSPAQSPEQQQYSPPENSNEQQYSPAQSPEQQQYSPPQSPAEQRNSPAQNPEQQQYSPPQNTNVQQYSPVQNPNQQQYSPPQSPVAQEYSPAQSPEQQQYSPAQNTNVQQYSPVQNPNQQQYSPPQSPVAQEYSPAQSPEQRQYSPPQSPNEQQYSPAQNANQQPYSPPQNINYQQNSPPQNANNQQYSAPPYASGQQYSAPENTNYQQYPVPQSAISLQPQSENNQMQPQVSQPAENVLNQQDESQNIVQQAPPLVPQNANVQEPQAPQPARNVLYQQNTNPNIAQQAPPPDESPRPVQYPYQNQDNQNQQETAIVDQNLPQKEYQPNQQEKGAGEHKSQKLSRHKKPFPGKGKIFPKLKEKKEEIILELERKPVISLLQKAQDRLSKMIANCTTDQHCAADASCIQHNPRIAGFCRCSTGFQGNGIFCWEEIKVRNLFSKNQRTENDQRGYLTEETTEETTTEGKFLFKRHTHG